MSYAGSLTHICAGFPEEITDRPELDCRFEEVGESSDTPLNRKPDQISPPERDLPDAPESRHLSPGEAEVGGLAGKDTSPPPLASTAPLVKEEMAEAEMVPIKQEPQEVDRGRGAGCR